MTLRILCFEDSDEHVKKLKKAFKSHRAKWLTSDLRGSWNEESDLAKRITQFKPDLAIVDLIDQAGEIADAGFRIIRKLKTLPATDGIPVIAWSVSLDHSDRGKAVREKVKGYDAIALQKPKGVYRADQFLRAARLIE